MQLCNFFRLGLAISKKIDFAGNRVSRSILRGGSNVSSKKMKHYQSRSRRRIFSLKRTWYVDHNS